MPSLKLTTDARPTRVRSASTAVTAGRAAIVLAIALLLAACQPPSAALPAVSTSHVVVPATGLPNATNVVLDGQVFDTAVLLACQGTPPEAADFFGGDLARFAVGSLATLPTDLAQQRAYAGAALISGYAAGQDLHQHFGVQLLDQPQPPFGDLSMLVNADTSMPVLDQLVGQFLLLANGDASAAVASIAAMTPLIAQLQQQAAANFGATDLPPQLDHLMASLVAASDSVMAAATAGASGDAAAARRAEASIAGIISWAGGYFLGITATTPWTAPTYVC